MGIKAFNHGDDFVNKFVRAVVSDSTGLDAVGPNFTPNFGDPQGITATGGVIGDYIDPAPPPATTNHSIVDPKLLVASDTTNDPDVVKICAL